MARALRCRAKASSTFGDIVPALCGPRASFRIFVNRIFSTEWPGMGGLSPNYNRSGCPSAPPVHRNADAPYERCIGSYKPHRQALEQMLFVDLRRVRAHGRHDGFGAPSWPAYAGAERGPKESIINELI